MEINFEISTKKSRQIQFDFFVAGIICGKSNKK